MADLLVNCSQQTHINCPSLVMFLEVLSHRKQKADVSFPLDDCFSWPFPPLPLLIPDYFAMALLLHPGLSTTQEIVIGLKKYKQDRVGFIHPFIQNRTDLYCHCNMYNEIKMPTSQCTIHTVKNKNKHTQPDILCHLHDPLLH